MNSNIKNRSVWFWAFLALLIFNVVTASSFFFFRSNQNKTVKSPVIEKIKAKANLDDQQVDTLLMLRKAHRDVMEKYRSQLFSLQGKLMDEYGKEMPDSLVVKQIKEDMLLIHGKMIDESGQFFGRSRGVCNPDQYRQMHRFYRDEFMRGPRGGRGNGPRGMGRFMNGNNN